MIAILSATEHDYYAMPLPFVVYSWWKIGVRCIVFTPPLKENKKLRLAEQYCSHTIFKEFTCEERRIPTYSQVIRLFGAANNLPFDEVLITGDSDMCVFGDFFEQLNDGGIHVVGADLTPQDQYPICYAAMPVRRWRNVMNMWQEDGEDELGLKTGHLKTHQECVSELIDPIQGLDIRGEQWSYDQWYLKKMLTGADIVFHNRSNGQNQFAQHRADRDGWHFNPDTLIDAHLPRPLTDESNFNKVCELFHTKYPDDNLDWMCEFRDKYMKLL